MKRNILSASLLTAGVFVLLSLVPACKKDDTSSKPNTQKDTAYILTSIHRNDIFLDSLVYDTATLLLQKILSPDAGTGTYSRMEFTYNKDKKVTLVTSYNSTGDVIGSDSVAYNKVGFTVYHSYLQMPATDSTPYTINTDGQASLTGSKDTVQNNGLNQMVYQAITLSAKNTTQSDIETYYSDGFNATSSSKKALLTYNTDSYPNPFYALYRNYAPLTDYWLPQLDYAFDAVNNPASVSYTEAFNSTDGTTDNSSSQTGFTYVYDSISHYPLQQSYKITESDGNGGTHDQQYTIYFNYKSVVTTKK